VCETFEKQEATRATYAATAAAIVAIAWHRFRHDSLDAMHAAMNWSDTADENDFLNLDFSYTLDRGVFVGIFNEAWADVTAGGVCTRDATKTTVTCGNGCANVISLNDNAAALEIRVPPVLPLVYKVLTEGVIRATYKIEMPADRVGSTPLFSFTPTAADGIYAAYFTLEDYYKVRDYLGTLYDYGQISRILNLDGYSAYPVLATKFSAHSLFSGF
jgi:hypothetical protein